MHGIKEKDIIWSVGDWQDIDSKLMKQVTDFSMESNDLVAFLFELKGCASFKYKGSRCLLISLEPKHIYDRGITPKDFIVGALDSRDVLTWIFKFELQIN